MELERNPEELEAYLRRRMEGNPEAERAAYDARLNTADRAAERGDQANLMAGLLSASAKIGSYGGQVQQPDTKPLLAAADQAQTQAQGLETRADLGIKDQRKERMAATEAYLKNKRDAEVRASAFDAKKKEKEEERIARTQDKEDQRKWQEEQNALNRSASMDRANVMAANKPATDSQMNAASFGKKAQDAASVADQIEASGYDAAGYGRMARDLPFVGKFTKSEPDRQYEQAQKEFIAAILRKESGGAITPDEFTEYGAIYFPQPGDGPDVKAQKAASRKRATESLIAQSGKAAAQVPSTPYQVPAPRAGSGEAQAAPSQKPIDQMTPEEMQAELDELEAQSRGASGGY